MTAKKTDATKAAEEAKAAKGYKVAKGVTLTSKRGILASGSAVEAGYLSGGQESLDKLLASKKIVKL